VDAGGRVIGHTHPNETTTLLGRARWMRGTITGYELLGNVPWWICVIVVAIMASMPSKGILRQWQRRE
jgi:apolipoprotein N-acyltransferase